MGSSLVVPLVKARSAESGGKACNLRYAEMAGLTVPETYIVTVDAWRKFVDQAGDFVSGLQLPAKNAVEIERNREAAGVIRSLLSAASVPDDVTREVKSVLRQVLVGSGVAVRSSAVAEDAARESFAGQFESYLNLKSSAEILTSIKACWLSGVEARVFEYQNRKREDSVFPLPMAVLLQKMVAASVSGIAFSRDPVSGDNSRIWITSNFGLGTTVVDGSVVPDTYIVDRSSGEVVSAVVGDKHAREEPAPAGVRRVDVDASERRRSSLDGESLRLIWNAVLRCEEFLDRDADLEWAFEGCELSVLQVRPITVL